MVIFVRLSYLADRPLGFPHQYLAGTWDRVCIVILRSVYALVWTRTRHRLLGLTCASERKIEVVFYLSNDHFVLIRNDAKQQPRLFPARVRLWGPQTISRLLPRCWWIFRRKDGSDICLLYLSVHGGCKSYNRQGGMLLSQLGTFLDLLCEFEFLYY